MKQSNKVKRLEARRKDFDSLKNTGGRRRPGSLKR